MALYDFTNSKQAKQTNRHTQIKEHEALTSQHVTYHRLSLRNNITHRHFYNAQSTVMGYMLIICHDEHLYLSLPNRAPEYI